MTVRASEDPRFTEEFERLSLEVQAAIARYFRARDAHCRATAELMQAGKAERRARDAFLAFVSNRAGFLDPRLANISTPTPDGEQS